jgi:transmembrane sensor
VNSSKIEERAAEWLAKRDSGSWTGDDERELQAWLDASTAHNVAFIRLEAAWSQALRLKALGAGAPRGVVPPRDAWDRSPFFETRDGPKPGLAPLASSAPVASTAPPASLASPAATRRPPMRRRISRALIASALVFVVGVLGWFSTRGPDYRTPIGGIASVPMTDGSKVTLNTDSAIRIAVTARERRVQLEQGEAFFEVAHDPSRPFVVTAGSRRVIAVGTKFSVRRIGNEVRVFVTEGKVRFEDDSLPAGSQSAGSAAPSPRETLLPAGTIARAGDSGVLVQEKPLPEVEECLSWRVGYLVFHDTLLADAVVEFNRYNEHKLVIEDPEVAGIRLSGKFRATNFEGFVRLLAEGFPIEVRHAGGQILLSAHTANQSVR